MINGLGVLGWGVGGIEAEAAMLGQPLYMVTPQVVGFKLTGELREGVTATDLVLTVTQMLRKKGVVEKFVEFYGPGLGADDRSPTARRSPTWRPSTARRCGFFPVDDETLALPAPHRPQRRRGRRSSSATARSRACSAPTATPEPDVQRHARARPRRRSSRASPARSARRIACALGADEERVPRRRSRRP